MQCILVASYCYCISGNRQFSISHSKGINSGMDILATCICCGVKSFVSLLHLIVVPIYAILKLMLEDKSCFQTMGVQLKGGRKFELFLFLSSTLLIL